MTDGQRHFVGTWTFNLFFSKGPLSFSLQVSPSVFLLCVDLSFLPRPCPHSFNFLSFPFLFILSAPFHPFISLVHVPPTCFYLPPPLWYFHIGVVFPFLPPFTLSWIHHWFPLTLNRSLIHYFHLFTPCPALAVFFEIRWCSQSLMDVLQFLSPFSYQSIYPCQHHGHMFKLTARTRFTQAWRRLTRAPTFAKYLHDFVFLQRLGQPVPPSHIWFQVTACVLCCVVLDFHFPKRLGFIWNVLRQWMHPNLTLYEVSITKRLHLE